MVEGDAGPSPDGYGRATFMVSAEGGGPGRPASCTLNGAPCTFARPATGRTATRTSAALSQGQATAAGQPATNGLTGHKARA